MTQITVTSVGMSIYQYLITDSDSFWIHPKACSLTWNGLSWFSAPVVYGRPIPRAAEDGTYLPNNLHALATHLVIRPQATWKLMNVVLIFQSVFKIQMYFTQSLHLSLQWVFSFWWEITFPCIIYAVWGNCWEVQQTEKRRDMQK